MGKAQLPLGATPLEEMPVEGMPIQRWKQETPNPCIPYERRLRLVPTLPGVPQVTAVVRKMPPIELGEEGAISREIGIHDGPTDPYWGRPTVRVEVAYSDRTFRELLEEHGWPSLEIEKIRNAVAGCTKF